MRPAAPACPACAAALERLGGSSQGRPGERVTVVHWVCPACRKRWLEHSRHGWRETTLRLDD